MPPKQKEVLPGYSDEEASSDDEFDASRRRRSGDNDGEDDVVEVGKLDDSEDDSDEDDRKHKDPSYWDKVHAKEKQKLDQQAKAWGKNRDAYYNSDTVDFDYESDEEAAKMEENEALKLQRQQAASLDDADFGLGDVLAAVGKSSSAAGAGAGKSTKKTAGAAGKDRSVAAAAGSVGELKLSSSASSSSSKLPALNKDEKIKQVVADSPELTALLEEYTARMQELRTEIEPLVEKAKRLDPSLATTDGISFLQMKHQLLLSYCIHIAFYLLLKAEGKSVQQHPVIKRLVQIRVTLEKLRPVDKQLKYQIDKMLQAGALGADGDGAAGANLDLAAKQLDLLAFKPRLGSLATEGGYGGDDDDDVMDLDAVAKAAGAAKSKSTKGRKASAPSYEDDDVDESTMDADMRPSRLMGAATFDSSERKSSRDRRQERLRGSATGARLLKEIREELSERPIEDTAEGLAAPQLDREDRERLEYEEENYMRLMETKEQKRKRKRAENLGGFNEFADFTDVSGLTEMAEQRLAEKAKARAQLEEMRARSRGDGARGRGVDGEGDDDDDDVGDYGGFDDGDDDDEAHSKQYSSEDAAYYREKQQLASKRSKKQRLEPVFAAPNEHYVEEGSKRSAGKKIIKNRGLVRSRPRDSANPRAAYRHKHEKAMVKHRAQHREYTGKSDEGLKSIKRNIIKGTKLN